MPRGWYKLDNVAKMFVATHSRRDPRVFRISCTLKECVDPTALGRALAETARQFKSFQVTLHQGLFWHYLETASHAPEPEPETLAPCAEIYGPTRHNLLLYRVSWYGCRINLEVFHVLSDGTGALDFLKTLVCLYLKEKHPADLADVVPEYDASAADRAQDSFRRFYGKRHAGAEKQPLAYHMHGSRLPYDQTQFFEIHLPTAQLLAASRQYGVSATSFLAASLMKAIYAEMPEMERGRPVVISIPVNLRNYYPSATARNFFNTIKVSHIFHGEETQEEVAKAFHAKLKACLTPEYIKAQMDGFEQLEHLLAVKAVPLALKNPGVRFFNWLETRKETATISNLGNVTITPALAPYIQSFSALSSTSKMFLTVCSFGHETILGASSVFRNTNVLKDMVRGLQMAGLAPTIYATEVDAG